MATPYAAQVTVDGPLVFVSGQTPLTDGALANDDIVAQTRATLANVKRVLASAGASIHDVVRVGVFLDDLTDLQAFNEEYSAVFAPRFPARTLVGARLPGYRVEIDCVARLAHP